MEDEQAATRAGSAMAAEQRDCAGMDIGAETTGPPAAGQSEKEMDALVSTMVETPAEVCRKEAAVRTRVLGVLKRDRDNQRKCVLWPVHLWAVGCAAAFSPQTHP